MNTSVNTTERLAMVITHTGARAGLADIPWLEIGFNVDASDWLVLPAEDWRAAAGGDPAVWDALERKLLIGFYLTQPRLIAVLGHPGERGGEDAEHVGRAEVRRIVRRVRSLLLPSTVLGAWADEDGWLKDFIDGDESTDGPAAQAPVRAEAFEAAARRGDAGGV